MDILISLLCTGVQDGWVTINRQVRQTRPAALFRGACFQDEASHLGPDFAVKTQKNAASTKGVANVTIWAATGGALASALRPQPAQAICQTPQRCWVDVCVDGRVRCLPSAFTQTQRLSIVYIPCLRLC